MPKNTHEIRDPIHVFVRLDTDERRVLDSKPFQRLRHIHQLALSSLVYPGATHRRFEHSLGVMELAGRVFDVVTHPDSLIQQIREQLPEVASPDKKSYWRRVLRMAALCHDVGHLPFSHAAETELLPEGWNHERLTRILIESEEMGAIWGNLQPPLTPEHVVKLALGPKHAKGLEFTDGETILAEIITGDAFGVDRMDYLLRDSHHIGVAYGRFDHFRLIDTLRILPPPQSEVDGSIEPALGVEEGGLQSAEALLLARYFMFSQVYFHPIRRIYDIHLKDFLANWLPGGRFGTSVTDHLALTDNEVMAALRAAATDSSKPGHDAARRIVQHEHFKVVYSRNPADIRVNPDAAGAVYDALCAKFGQEHFRRDRNPAKGGSFDFPVKAKDGRIVSSLAMSDALNHVPPIAIDTVYSDPSRVREVQSWLESNRAQTVEPKEGASQ